MDFPKKRNEICRLLKEISDSKNCVGSFLMGSKARFHQPDPRGFLCYSYVKGPVNGILT
jgi:hypothetical protein